MRHLSLALSNPLFFFFAQTWSQVIGLLSFDFDLLMISANYQISLILPFVTKPLVIIFFLRQLFLQCYNLLLLVLDLPHFSFFQKALNFLLQISQLKFLPEQLFLQSIIFLLRSESWKSSVPSSFWRSTSLVRSVTSSSVDSLLDNSLLNVTLRPFLSAKHTYIS